MNEPTTITLDGVRAESWNHYWSGQHWAKRRAEAERMALLVRAAVDVDACAVYTVPVAVTVTATYKSRPVDCENICAKAATDALIGLLLQDDDPRHVVSYTAISRKGTRDSIEIHLEPAQIADDFTQYR